MSRALRVFHLIKGLGRGGAEQLLVDARRQADQSRLEQGFGYFLPWKDALAPELRRLRADVVCFEASSVPAILASWRRVARHLRSWGADVVHCHLPLAGVAGRLAARWTGVPVVYTEHNLMERYHPLTRFTNLATWRLQREVIAVSEQVASSARRSAGTSVPIHVVRNGVVLERFSASDQSEARRRLGLVDAPTVGTVAVFREQKRLDLWLEMARIVRDRLPGARFLLVGDGPLRASVETQARSLGLAEVVHLAGLQEDVRPYVAAMDLFLMSSDFEGLPVALLEAMASSRAVVSTRVGGVPEVLDATCGALVEPGRPDLLADVAIRLLEEPGERARLGAAARGRVEASFSMARMLQDLEAVYARATRARA